jgi:hypothetical protein
MNNKNFKLNRWAYGFAALALILGCLLPMMSFYQTFPNIPVELEERVTLDNLTQLIIPGSADITFAKPGAYAVYYEYSSVNNGMRYENGSQPPSLECALTSKTSGEKVHAVPDYVETNTYSTKDQERVGVLIMSITIHDPGIYTFACQYPDGRTQPEIVVSVGPNFIWEFFNIFAKVGCSILSGMAIFFFSVLFSIIVILIVVVKRTQAKKRLET